MQEGSVVKICTYGRQYNNGKIVGTELDNLVGRFQVFRVRHPDFPYDVFFYCDAPHKNVGNAAYWIEEQ